MRGDEVVLPSFLLDDGPNESELESLEFELGLYPTYVSIRPNWNAPSRLRGPESKIMTFERKETTVYKKKDYVGGGYGVPHVKTTTEEYAGPKQTIAVRERKTPYFPRLSESGRRVGKPREDKVSENFARRMKIYELFGESQYDFEVRIGIVDESAVHVGFDGRSVPYDILFHDLGVLGFFPLAPIQDEKIMAHLRRSLSVAIFSAIKGRKSRHDSILRKVEVWARNIRDLVRDYLRGQNTIVPKGMLEQSTIYTRNSRQEKNGSLYRYGTANALWEAGTLENDITFKVIPIKGGKVTLTPGDRKRIKDLEDEEKKRKRRSAERTREETRENKRKTTETSTPPTSVDTAQGPQKRELTYREQQVLAARLELGRKLDVMRKALEKSGVDYKGIDIESRAFSDIIASLHDRDVKEAYIRALQIRSAFRR